MLLEEKSHQQSSEAVNSPESYSNNSQARYDHWYKGGIDVRRVATTF